VLPVFNGRRRLCGLGIKAEEVLILWRGSGVCFSDTERILWETRLFFPEFLCSGLKVNSSWLVINTIAIGPLAICPS